MKKSNKSFKIISLTLLSVSSISFLGLTIGGDLFNKNYHTLSQLEQKNQLFEFNEGQNTLNGVVMDCQDIVNLKNFFELNEFNQKNYYYEFFTSTNVYQQWNTWWRNDQLKLLESSISGFNDILEKYQSQNDLFSQHITTSKALNYNVIANNYILFLSLTLTIISFGLLIYLAIIWTIQGKKNK